MTKIIRGEDAILLRKKLKPLGKKARNLVEFGVGTNPRAIITGKSIEDEKALGTVHIAMGDPLLEGGIFGNKCHIDAILKQPTLEIDGRLIMKDGKLLI